MCGYARPKTGREESGGLQARGGERESACTLWGGAGDSTHTHGTERKSARTWGERASERGRRGREKAHAHVGGREREQTHAEERDRERKSTHTGEEREEESTCTRGGERERMHAWERGRERKCMDSWERGRESARTHAGERKKSARTRGIGGERENARMHMRGRAALWLLFLYVFRPPGLPYANRAWPGVLFVLPEVLTPLFPSLRPSDLP